MMDWLIGRPLHVASLENNAAFVRQALKECSESEVNERNLWGYTALHAAAWAGHVDIVNDLISSGAKVNKADNLLNLTPLWCASRSGHVDVIVTLLRHGADVGAAPDCSRDTPLHTAARFTWPDAVHALLENKAKVDATDCDGNTPLHYVCQKLAQDQEHPHTENYAVCRLLIKYGADLNARNNACVSPIQLVKRQRLVTSTLKRFHEDSKRSLQEPMEMEPAAILDVRQKNDCNNSEKQLDDLERKVELLNAKLGMIDRMCSDVPQAMQNCFEAQIHNAFQSYAHDVNADVQDKISFACDKTRRHDNVLAVMQDRVSCIEKQQLIFRDEIAFTRESLAQLREDVLKMRRNTAPPSVSLVSNEWVPVFQLISRQIGLKWDDLYRALVKQHVRNMLEIEATVSHIQELHPRNLYRQAYSSLVKASVTCGQQFNTQLLVTCLMDIGKNETAMMVKNLQRKT